MPVAQLEQDQRQSLLKLTMILNVFCAFNNSIFSLQDYCIPLKM